MTKPKGISDYYVTLARTHLRVDTETPLAVIAKRVAATPEEWGTLSHALLRLCDAGLVHRRRAKVTMNGTTAEKWVYRLVEDA